MFEIDESEWVGGDSDSAIVENHSISWHGSFEAEAVASVSSMEDILELKDPLPIDLETSALQDEDDVFIGLYEQFDDAQDQLAGLVRNFQDNLLFEEDILEFNQALVQLSSLLVQCASHSHREIFAEQLLAKGLIELFQSSCDLFLPQVTFGEAGRLGELMANTLAEGVKCVNQIIVFVGVEVFWQNIASADEFFDTLEQLVHVADRSLQPIQIDSLLCAEQSLDCLCVVSQSASLSRKALAEFWLDTIEANHTQRLCQLFFAVVDASRSQSEFGVVVGLLEKCIEFMRSLCIDAPISCFHSIPALFYYKRIAQLNAECKCTSCVRLSNQIDSLHHQPLPFLASSFIEVFLVLLQNQVDCRILATALEALARLSPPSSLPSSACMFADLILFMLHFFPNFAHFLSLEIDELESQLIVVTLSCVDSESVKLAGATRVRELGFDPCQYLVEVVVWIVCCKQQRGHEVALKQGVVKQVQQLFSESVAAARNQRAIVLLQLKHCFKELSSLQSPSQLAEYAANVFAFAAAQPAFVDDFFTSILNLLFALVDRSSNSHSTLRQLPRCNMLKSIASLVSIEPPANWSFAAFSQLSVAEECVDIDCGDCADETAVFIDLRHRPLCLTIICEIFL